MPHFVASQDQTKRILWYQIVVVVKPYQNTDHFFAVIRQVETVRLIGNNVRQLVQDEERIHRASLRVDTNRDLEQRVRVVVVVHIHDAMIDSRQFFPHDAQLDWYESVLLAHSLNKPHRLLPRHLRAKVWLGRDTALGLVKCFALRVCRIPSEFPYYRHDETLVVDAATERQFDGFCHRARLL